MTAVWKGAGTLVAANQTGIDNRLIVALFGQWQTGQSQCQHAKASPQLKGSDDGSTCIYLTEEGLD